MSTRLRVAAYRWGDRARGEEARRALRSLSPDVLVLHHVPGHPFAGHRIAGFADRLDLMWSGGPHRRSGGTTILTSLRLDVLDERHVPLGAGGRSGYAVTRLRLPGHRPCLVVGAHLSDADGVTDLARLREQVDEDGAPLAALSVDVAADGLPGGWPDLAAVVVPVGDQVTSAVVDLDTIGTG